MTRLAFLYLETLHQIPHSLPIAVALKRANPAFQIELITLDDAQDLFIDRILSRIAGGLRFGRRRLRPMPVLGALSRLSGIDRRAKIATLLWNFRTLNSYDAVVVPERTTTLLKRLHLMTSALIGTEHGAGDRAVTFSTALKLYDFLLLPGDKSAARATELGLATPGKYAVPGYVKLECVETDKSRRHDWFPNDKPIVLYTPHFDQKFSSWEKEGKAILDHFAAQNKYNLIFAPHIRLFAGQQKKSELLQQRYQSHPNIMIDTGSTNSVDMSYVMNSDIYLGDVSSQVYEFFTLPRPAIFLNSHGVAWQNDPNYLFWKCGDVINSLADLKHILPKSLERHRFYAAKQKQLTKSAFGATDGKASLRAAHAITNFLGLPSAEVAPAVTPLPTQARQSA
jgi:CDP-Glycerol:Poly(glycerophosphate) glycerophosphotransferase